jgi:hypothetical protein
MISTHNHVDMAASLVGAGQFKLTLLPPTRASNSVTARRPPGPGSTAALRAGSQRPCTRGLPADLGWPGSRPRVGPVGPSPSGHAQPAQPQAYRPAPHKRRTRQASSDPTRSQRARQSAWRGREAFALLGWGNNPSMVMLRRNGRRRAAGAGPMVRAFGETRTCVEDGCTAQLHPARLHRRGRLHRPRRRRCAHVAKRDRRPGRDDRSAAAPEGCCSTDRHPGSRQLPLLGGHSGTRLWRGLGSSGWSWDGP